MSVIDTKEIWNGRKAQYNEYNERAYTRVFRLVTDNTFDGPLTIMLASPVKVGDAYQDPNGVFDSTSFCRIVDPRQDQNDPQTWEVVCEFSNIANVLQRPAVFSWGVETAQVALDQAYSATLEQQPNFVETTGGSDTNDDTLIPILNVNGERFDPQPSGVETIQILTITFNKLEFNDVQAAGVQNSLNATPIYNRPRLSGLLRSWTANRQEQGNLQYWQHTVVIAWRNPFSDFAPDWKQRVLNVGYNALVSDDNGNEKLTQVRDQNGMPYARPVPLTATGFEMFPAGEKVDFSTNPPVFIAFRTNPIVDWNQFGWPTLPN